MQTLSLLITRSNGQTSSLRSRLGLPEFNNENIPSGLRIESSQRYPITKELAGDYTLLPHCGTAMSSLYKKLVEVPFYLFLDPDPIGIANQDSFVFSSECEKVPCRESRIIARRLDLSWKPWINLHKGNDNDNIRVTIPGIWKPVQLVLTTDMHSIHVQYPEHSTTSSLGDCSQITMILKARFKAPIDIHDYFSYSWAAEQAKFIPYFN